MRYKYIKTGDALVPLPPDRDQLKSAHKDNVVYDSVSRVICIAPGVLLKYAAGDVSEEIMAAEFARKRFSILTPRILAYPRRHPTKRFHGLWYLAMERCRGVSLNRTIETMLTDQLDHIATQLRPILNKMASLRPTTLGSVNGGPYRNFYFPPHLSPKHAFTSVGEFIDHYRWILRLFCTEKYTEGLLSRLPRNSAIRFVHGDLHPGNIMVDGSTITAIIDWHTAGFYPQFWEYCRMHDPYLMTPNWGHVLGRIFPGEKREMEIWGVRELVSTISFNC